MTKPRKPRPSPDSFASRTIAPAPSPKRTARSRIPVARSYQYGSHGPSGPAEHHVPHGLGPRHEAGVDLGTDEEDPVVRPRADERVGRLEAGEESGALHPDVEGVGRRHPEPRREEAAASREVVVRRHRREDDEVDVGGRQGRFLQSRAGRVLGELGRTDPRLDEPALPDARTRDDPLVGGVHDPREHLVRDDLGRKVAARAADDGRSLCGAHARAGSLARPIRRREVGVPGPDSRPRRLPRGRVSERGSSSSVSARTAPARHAC